MMILLKGYLFRLITQVARYCTTCNNYNKQPASILTQRHKTFFDKLLHAHNKCDLLDVAIEKTERTEKKTFGFFGDYPLQKS